MSQLSNIFKAAARTIHDTPKWKSWTGSPENAIARVFVADVPKASLATAVLPVCRINGDDKERWELLGPGAGAMLRGSLVMTVWDAYDWTAGADSLESQLHTFRENVGELIEDMIELSQIGVDAYLFMRSIETNDPISFPDLDEDEGARLIFGSWMIEWGPDGISSGE